MIPITIGSRCIVIGSNVSTEGDQEFAFSADGGLKIYRAKMTDEEYRMLYGLVIRAISGLSVEEKQLASVAIGEKTT